jgi:hypothetical protein
MQACTVAHPVPVPVSRSLVRRVMDALSDSWQDWRLRGLEAKGLRQLSSLDRHMLDDIGVPNHVRSLAAAMQEARHDRLQRLERPW